MDICICVSDWLSGIAESSTTLQIKCTPIKIKITKKGHIMARLLKAKDKKQVESSKRKITCFRQRSNIHVMTNFYFISQKSRRTCLKCWKQREKKPAMQYSLSKENILQEWRWFWWWWWHNLVKTLKTTELYPLKGWIYDMLIVSR